MAGEDAVGYLFLLGIVFPFDVPAKREVFLSAFITGWDSHRKWMWDTRSNLVSPPQRSHLDLVPPRWG